MNNDWIKKEQESFTEYCHRISSKREEYGLNWTQVANIINKNTNSNYSADKYRKQEKRYLNPLLNDMNNEEESETVLVNAIESPDREKVMINFDRGETTSQKDIVLTTKELNDPVSLLKAHGFDPNCFEIKSATNIRSKRKSLDNENYFYHSRVLVKPKKISTNDFDEIVEYFKTVEFPKEENFKEKEKTSSSETLMIPLYDLHWGRFPEQKDFVRYDIKEEKEKILSHVKNYTKKFKNRTFKQVYLIVGQDFLNSSFTGYTSSQSHLQSNAVDFKTMFKTGSELLISIIEIFKEFTPCLKIIGSLGNHDTAEEIALFSLLKAYYRNDSEVKVDDSPAPRKYVRIGVTCVGVGHFDKEKQRIHGLMQVEAKKIWGQTKFHYLIAGHLHHFEVDSKQGVQLFRMPCLCDPDRWTVEQGYVMDPRGTIGFVFDDEKGPTEMHFMYL